MTRGDVTKLPKWAQFEIQRLEQDNATYLARLSEGPDSDTFADPYSDAKRPLGKGTIIQFDLGERFGQRINCRIDTLQNGERVLDVMGGDTVTIEPQSSNAFRVRVRERTL
jgi:hypothetical protein